MKKLIAAILLLISVNLYADNLQITAPSEPPMAWFHFDNNTPLNIRLLWWFVNPHTTMSQDRDNLYRIGTLLNPPDGTVVYLFFTCCDENGVNCDQHDGIEVWVDKYKGIQKLVYSCTVKNIKYPVSWQPGLLGTVSVNTP